MNFFTMFRMAQPRREEQQEIIEDYAEQIQAEEGRKQVKVVVTHAAPEPACIKPPSAESSAASEGKASAGSCTVVGESHANVVSFLITQ